MRLVRGCPPGQRVASQHGATLIEFTLALFFGVLPMVLAIWQVAALLVARNTVNLATFMAARQGAVAGAEPAVMNRELARGLVPLYVRASRGGVTPAHAVAAAYAAALADVSALDSRWCTTRPAVPWPDLAYCALAGASFPTITSSTARCRCRKPTC